MNLVSDQIAALLERIKEMIPSAKPGECPALLGALEQLKVMIWLQVTNAQTLPNVAVDTTPERYLLPEEVAQRFGVTKKWLYDHKRNLPHTQPTRKTLRFPEKAIQRWFANRKRS